MHLRQHAVFGNQGVFATGGDGFRVDVLRDATAGRNALGGPGSADVVVQLVDRLIDATRVGADVIRAEERVPHPVQQVARLRRERSTHLLPQPQLRLDQRRVLAQQGIEQAIAGWVEPPEIIHL